MGSLMAPHRTQTPPSDHTPYRIYLVSFHKLSHCISSSAAISISRCATNSLVFVDKKAATMLGHSLVCSDHLRVDQKGGRPTETMFSGEN